MLEDKKIILGEKDIPRQWYNIVADLKPMDPPFNTQTGKIATKEDFLPIFCEDIIDQEMSRERFIDIPEEVVHIYKI